MKETPRKIPLEAIVKWLDKRVKAAESTLSGKDAEIRDLKNQISARDKALFKKAQRISALEAECSRLQQDFKLEYRNTDWYKGMCKQLAERNEAIRNLRRNYNTVLAELNNLRDKYGE